MRRKWFGAALGLVIMVTVGTIPVLAAEMQSEESEMETEVQDVETDEAEEIILSVDGKEISVKNETGLDDLSAEVTSDQEGAVPAETDEEGAETSDSEADEETTVSETEEDSLWTVTFFGENGESHVFTSVNPTEWTDAVLTENYGFLYLQYTAEDGETKELEESAEEKTLDEELTMWTLTDVYVRESADPEAQAVKVASLGDECTVTAVLPGWYQVEYDGVTGYIRYKYLTDDQSASEAAVAQEQSARAAEEAAAAAQAYSGSGSGSGGSSGGGGGSSQQECLENGLLN